MEKSVAVFAAINFAIIGLSHVCQKLAWREFFQSLHTMGRPGAFANGLMTLFMGSLIVSFHNIWSGIPIILTVIGWAYVVKSTVIFVYPDWSLRSMASVQTASPLKFQVAGTGLILIAGTLFSCIAFGLYD